MKRTSITSIIVALLVVLWVYASLSKLLDFDRSRNQMLNQVFLNSIAKILAWMVPTAELIISVLLLFTKTKLFGLYASAFLLLNFTVYIGLVMSNVFGRIPCSCGGILEKMSWGQHMAFNIFFIAITSMAILFMEQDKAFAERTFTNEKGGSQQV